MVYLLVSASLPDYEDLRTQTRSYLTLNPQCRAQDLTYENPEDRLPVGDQEFSATQISAGS